MQAIDPFFQISYQELGRNWAALAEKSEWLDSHQLPADFSRSCSVGDQLLCRGMALISWSFPGVDNVTKCRERAQRSERAATETDPERREYWQRVADAWHRAAEAARTPR